ncbi:MAG: universal stress protein [Gemmatimonadales bacterium]|nr:MAG: universal stress protein [Gemmatimonadales bacterium]
MFKRALVSMDLSPATEALVAGLPGLRDYGVEEIVLVHVAKPVTYPVSQSIAEVDLVRQRLGRLQASLEAQGFQVVVDVPIGAAAAEVAREAEERAVDLIVVGSRSHARIRDAFVGSVAWEVVRRSRVPVLLKRIEASRHDPEGALEIRGSGLPEKVVHPTDFSEVAERAFPWVLGMARAGVPNFTLLHVHAVGNDEGRAEGRVRLEALAHQITEAGATNVEVEVRGGTAAEEILNVGGRDYHSLVIMGTQGRGFLPEIVLGSQSRQVVRQASATVLLVPSAEPPR